MPSSALAFRAVCGRFVAVFASFMMKRARMKAAMRICTLKLATRLDGVIVGLLLTLLFYGNLIHQCGDVELNPGPTSKSNGMRQTRLTSGGGPRRESVDRPGSTSETVPSQSGEPSMNDVMTMLNTMNTKFDKMCGDMKDIKDVCSSLQGQMSELKQEMLDLKHENETLQHENEQLRAKVEVLDRKVDDLEGRSKRNNIIIHGIPRVDKETWQDCEDSVHEMFTDKLEFSNDIPFDRVHRLNSKPNSPIIACCTFYKDKAKILRARQKLKGSQIFINEDFSLRIREVRKKLLPRLKNARSQNKQSSMVYDHLIIEGQKFGLDKDDKLVKLP